jgi:hypothetical protein
MSYRTGRPSQLMHGSTRGRADACRTRLRGEVLRGQCFRRFRARRVLIGYQHSKLSRWMIPARTIAIASLPQRSLMIRSAAPRVISPA